MKINKIIAASFLLVTQSVWAHGPEPMPLQKAPIPAVPGLLDGPDPIVVNKDKAIALGKALFWDVNVGSDGMACGSCHHQAGADRRIKNQLNPGTKNVAAPGADQTFQAMPSGAGGPNYTLTSDDFPLYRFADPFSRAGGKTFSTNDAVASAGTFSGEFTSASKFSGSNDECSRSTDPTFHVGSIGTRRVEPRNTPSMINAVFNYRSFWDGRANNIFNGSSVWGDRDPDAGVWVKSGPRSISKQRLHLVNSSLASLAVGPPLNDAEMSCRQRSWPRIGRKLLLRQPLQNQKVHYQDSVLGAYSFSSASELKPGLNTTYKNLVTQAFNSKYWSFSGTGGQLGAPLGETPYNQMEANFSMFFGIALQLYQSTLVSDQAPIDLSERDPATMRPTWVFPASTGIVKTSEEIASLTNGFKQFVDIHCNVCHTGPLLTTAAVETNSILVTPTPGKTYGPDYFPISYGPDAMAHGNAAAASGITANKNVVQRDATIAKQKLMDMGFANTGVNDPNADPGIDGVDDFGNPLSFTKQYVQYLLGNYGAIKDADVLSNVKSCDFIGALATTSSSATSDTFKVLADIEVDGTREGVLRNQNCRYGNSINGYIPTVAAANAAVGTTKMGVADKGAFKIPSLRNVELTGPYMHNGSMATLEQVVEFYARKGNVSIPENTFLHTLVNQMSITDAAGITAKDRADLVAFLKSLTDDRVRYEKAPFDHPEVIVPHGHIGDHQFVTPGNPLSTEFAKEEFMVIPAVGANGAFEADGSTPKPLQPFENHLAPAVP